MSSGEFAPDSVFPAKQLPDRDLWLYDPLKEGRRPTPTNDLGLIDLRELIRQTKQTIDPTYDWKSGFNDVHHLYWPNAWYENSPDTDVNPQEFRNLEISKLRVPRLFHNWVHILTEPPALPDEEVMRYRIEAQQAAKALERSLRSAKNLFERPYISDARLARGLDHHLSEFFTIKEQLASLPHEFRLIDLSPYEPTSIEDIPRISQEVKLAKHVTMATVLPIASRRRGVRDSQELLAS